MNKDQAHRQVGNRRPEDFTRVDETGCNCAHAGRGHPYQSILTVEMKHQEGFSCQRRQLLKRSVDVLGRTILDADKGRDFGTNCRNVSDQQLKFLDRAGLGLSVWLA